MRVGISPYINKTYQKSASSSKNLPNFTPPISNVFKYIPIQFYLSNTKNMKLGSNTYCRNWHLLLLCGLFFHLLPTHSSAQLNIKTGYSFSYNAPEVSSQLFSDFNQANEDWLDKKFKDFRWMHGLHLGARYRIAETIGLELGWITKFDKSEAEGVNSISGADYSKKYFYSQNQVHFALETLFSEHFGIGASINYDFLSIKARNGDSGNKSKILKENNYSSNFFFTYYSSQSNGTRFGFRPYVRVPWTDINYRDLANDLNESSQTETLSDRTLHFGISLLFFNGN